MPIDTDEFVLGQQIRGYVPIEELADYLHMKASTVRSWIKSGKIPSTAYLKINNTYRFFIPDVVEALKKTSESDIAMEAKAEIVKEVKAEAIAQAKADKVVAKPASIKPQQSTPLVLDDDSDDDETFLGE